MTTQTDERVYLGRQLLQLHSAGYTFKQLATQFHMTKDAAKGLIRTARLKQDRHLDVVHLGEPLDLRGDFIIVGDVHIPCTDWGFASLVGRVAERSGITKLIIAGDFFNFDAWSRYPAIVPAPTWQEERDAARVLLADWLEVFGEIYTLQGNHDRRLIKWSAAEFDEQDIWGMVVTSRKLQHSPYAWCTVTSGGQTWRVTHPGNYGRNQLTVASDLANKFDSHVITWHEHHAAHGWDVYGRHVVVNGGALVDPEKLAYVRLTDTRTPSMMRGFVVLRGGVATVLGEYPFTDWGAWLN